MKTTNQAEVRTFDLGGWDEAKAFVAAKFPTARHEGMGYWRIPRTAHIYYGIGRVKVAMMRGHDFTELGI